MEGLTVGRDVHYIDDDGEHCAAKVIHVLDTEMGDVCLFIMDHHGKLYHEYAVSHADVELEIKNTWHWPERV